MFIQPTWLTEASLLPLSFALVREDPLIDLEVLHLVNSKATRVAMIASGGCTAAFLVGQVAHLHLIDTNPAQLALARLKLHLLHTATTKERLELLGHLPLAYTERKQRLIALFKQLELSHDCFGSIEKVSELGPDHIGRYEQLFAQLRKRLNHQSDWQNLLCLDDLSKQTRWLEPSTSLGQSLDSTYDDIFSQSNLAQLFGDEATRNRVEPFARHFARRTRLCLATQPANTNPYLWLMLHGKLPTNIVLPWHGLPIHTSLANVEYSHGAMYTVLDNAKTSSYDFIHLSNILDWLSVDSARQTLKSTWRVLRPGGIVLIRQLNSTLDITNLGFDNNSGFLWDKAKADDLLRRDRSFFYRALHIGRKL